MLDKMIYRNSINEEVEFGANGIIVSSNDFRDYEWTYNSRYKKITGFNKNIVKKTLPILISGEDAQEKANRMFEIFDKDVLTGNHGTIIINGYELKGFFYASKKIKYTQKGILKMELSFVSDMPLWFKRSESHHFNVQQSNSRGLDYNYDFNHDFTSTLYTAHLANPNYADTAFELTFCGKAVDPVVVIGGNEYGIDGIIEEGEFITVDSLSKTVTLTRKDGSKVNKFGDRNKEHNIFEPIKAGGNNVSWSSDFSFDIVLIEQRSEPKWN